MDEILYNFAANHEQLDGIGRNLNEIQDIRSDIVQILGALGEVFGGDTWIAMQAKGHSILTALDDKVVESNGTQQGAVNKQDEMQAQDRTLSRQI
jgi:hypothetical protein